MLVKASVWAKKTFDADSIPDRRTIRQWISKGVIKGVIIDNNAFIDEQAFASQLSKGELEPTKEAEFKIREI